MLWGDRLRFYEEKIKTQWFLYIALDMFLLLNYNPVHKGSNFSL